MISQISENIIAWSAIIAIIIAQLLKLIINAIKIKSFDINRLWGVGGMPSSHSAAVSSLASAVFLDQGFSSLFAVCLIIGLIFLRDAMGLRMTVQKHTEILKKLSKDAENLDDFVGHKIWEVIAGIVLGILVSVVITFL